MKPILSPLRGFGRWPLAFIAAAIVSLWAAFCFDDPASDWILAHQNPSLRQLSGIISHYGDWPFLMIAGLGLVFLFRRLNRRQWVRMLCIMMVSSTLAGIAVNAARLTTGRARPNADVVPGWYGLRHDGQWIVGEYKFNSFPSGHTATAVGFAVPLLLLAPEAGIPALFVALLIAGSRIYLGAHRLSDVTAATVVAAWIALEISRRWPPSAPCKPAGSDE